MRALSTILQAARLAGGKLIVVDAIDNDAAAFYRHHHFEPLPNRPDRLVMKLSTAAPRSALTGRECDGEMSENHTRFFNLFVIQPIRHVVEQTNTTGNGGLTFGYKAGGESDR